MYCNYLACRFYLKLGVELELLENRVDPSLSPLCYLIGGFACNPKPLFLLLVHSNELIQDRIFFHLFSVRDLCLLFKLCSLNNIRNN